MAKDKTIYTEESIQSLSLSNKHFPPPHEPVYIINDKNRKERYYEKGWVLGNYGVVLLREIPKRNNRRWAEFINLNIEYLIERGVIYESQYLS